MITNGTISDAAPYTVEYVPETEDGEELEIVPETFILLPLDAVKIIAKLEPLLFPWAVNEPVSMQLSPTDVPIAETNDPLNRLPDSTNDNPNVYRGEDDPEGVICAFHVPVNGEACWTAC